MRINMNTGLQLIDLKKTFPINPQWSNNFKTPNKDILTVIGNTGVGKSTLINCLLGAKCTANKRPNDSQLILDVQQIGNLKIGHGPDSCTSESVIVHDKMTNIAFVDTPGFEDTQGNEQDLANAFYLTRTFKLIPRMRCIVAIEQTTFTAHRGNLFMELVRKLVHFFPNFDHFMPAISVVITKTHPADSPQKYLNLFSSFLKRADPREKLFLTHFIQNPQCIQLFPMPTHEGPVSNEIFKSMLNSITNNTLILPSPEVNITISDTCLLYVHELAKKLNELVKQTLEQILSSIFANYLQFIADVKSSLNSNDILKSKQTLGNLKRTFDYIDEWTKIQQTVNDSEQFLTAHIAQVEKIFPSMNSFKECLHYLQFLKSVHIQVEQNMRPVEWFTILREGWEKFAKEKSDLDQLLKSSDLIHLKQELDNVINSIEKSMCKGLKIGDVQDVAYLKQTVDNLAQRQWTSKDEFVYAVESELLFKLKINYNCERLRLMLSVGEFVQITNDRFINEFFKQLNDLVEHLEVSADDCSMDSDEDDGLTDSDASHSDFNLLESLNNAVRSAKTGADTPDASFAQIRKSLDKFKHVLIKSNETIDALIQNLIS